MTEIDYRECRTAPTGALVKIQHADLDGCNWMGWAGYDLVHVEFGGYVTMRRHLPTAPGAEPAPPRFPVLAA
jgi:hypothetical protein